MDIKKTTLVCATAAVGVLLINLAACKKDPSCPEGYTGSDCKTELVPREMSISNVKVLDWGSLDYNGQVYESTSLADLFVAVYQDTAVLWYPHSFITEADTNRTYTFTPVPAVKITDPKAQYTILVLDYDGPGADVIGGVDFVPYRPGENFPEFIEVTCNGCNVKLEVQLRYSF